AGPLDIVNNTFITSLEGLENIDYETIQSLVIGTNVNLDSCRYENICAYLNEEIGPYTIGNNAFGCENANVVKAACTTTSTSDLPKLQFQVSPNPIQEGMFTVQLQQNISRGHLEVFNNQGQQVRTQFFGHTSTVRVELPDAPGIYWLHIRNEQTQASGLHKLLVL
ncbi:MAG: T9SS type A sorting domain-containing protein, partial [Bacteroidota bacterium]